MVIFGYKLVRKRKDGTLGPLFIDRGRVLQIRVWMHAEAVSTKRLCLSSWLACLLKEECATPVQERTCMVQGCTVRRDGAPPAKVSRWALVHRRENDDYGGAMRHYTYDPLKTLLWSMWLGVCGAIGCLATLYAFGGRIVFRGHQ